MPKQANINNAVVLDKQNLNMTILEDFLGQREEVLRPALLLTQVALQCSVTCSGPVCRLRSEMKATCSDGSLLLVPSAMYSWSTCDY